MVGLMNKITFFVQKSISKDKLMSMSKQCSRFFFRINVMYFLSTQLLTFQWVYDFCDDLILVLSFSPFPICD